MADRTKPVSIRLTAAEIEQLQARAYEVSGTMTGIARDLRTAANQGLVPRRGLQKIISLQRSSSGCGRIRPL